MHPPLMPLREKTRLRASLVGWYSNLNLMWPLPNPIAKSYRAVHEVVISPQLLINARRSDVLYAHDWFEEKRLDSIWRKCLDVVTSAESSAASLHIEVHLTSRLNYGIVGSQFRLTYSAVRPTWEFFGASITYGPMYMALPLGFERLCISTSATPNLYRKKHCSMHSAGNLESLFLSRRTPARSSCVVSPRS